MVKLIASLIFATVLYFFALLIASASNASVGTVFAFLLAIVIIEDRIPNS